MDIVKWVGVKGVDPFQLDKGYLSRNAFPQRKTKASDQMILNLLIKYDKHYNRHNDEGPNNLLNSINPINREERTPKHMKLR